MLVKRPFAHHQRSKYQTWIEKPTYKGNHAKKEGLGPLSDMKWEGYDTGGLFAGRCLGVLDGRVLTFL
jgi:hypothetical protein